MERECPKCSSFEISCFTFSSILKDYCNICNGRGYIDWTDEIMHVNEIEEFDKKEEKIRKEMDLLFEKFKPYFKKLREK